MSNLSDLIPAGGGQNNTDFVADGTIVSGKGVILTAAGKAAPIAAVPAGGGTPVLFDIENPTSIACAYDSSAEKVVIAYNGASNYGTAIVGTVSGTSISYGTPVVFEAAVSSFISATFDSNANKIVIAYRDNGNSYYGTAIVGTVSGTSISFGSAVVFESANTQYTSIAFDSSNNKVVIAYKDNGNSNYGTGIVGTVSGTSISFGTAVVFESANTQYTATTFDSNSNKVAINYQDAGNSDYGTSVVGTVSGTAISFGTPVVFESAATAEISATFDTVSNRVVVSYQDQGNSFYGTANVGAISGTVITFGGTATVFEAANSTYTSAVYDTSSGNVVISYQDNGNTGDGTLVVGTVSGYAISFDTAVVVSTGNVYYLNSVYDSTNSTIVIAYADNTISDDGYSVVYTSGSTNLTSTNLLGVASAAIADTETGTINTWGSRNEVQTGLTIASNYYVQGDGTITTTSTSPAQLIGTAISATQINIKDYTG